MKLNLKDYLRKFETGETIESFKLVGGPEYVGNPLVYLLEEYDEEFGIGDIDDELFEVNDGFSDDYDLQLDCGKKLIKIMRTNPELKQVKDLVIDSLGGANLPENTDIHKLSGRKLDLFRSQLGYEYLTGEVHTRLIEYYTAFLIKFVLIPNNIEELDSELFTKFFNIIKNELYNINSDTLINEFKEYLKDTGINL